MASILYEVLKPTPPAFVGDKDAKAAALFSAVCRLFGFLSCYFTNSLKPPKQRARKEKDKENDGGAEPQGEGAPLSPPPR